MLPVRIVGDFMRRKVRRKVRREGKGCRRERIGCQQRPISSSNRNDKSQHGRQMHEKRKTD